MLKGQVYTDAADRWRAGLVWNEKILWAGTEGDGHRDRTRATQSIRRVRPDIEIEVLSGRDAGKTLPPIAKATFKLLPEKKSK